MLEPSHLRNVLSGKMEKQDFMLLPITSVMVLMSQYLFLSGPDPRAISLQTFSDHKVH